MDKIPIRVWFGRQYNRRTSLEHQKNSLTAAIVSYIGQMICSRKDTEPLSVLQLAARLASPWSNIASNSFAIWRDAIDYSLAKEIAIYPHKFLIVRTFIRPKPHMYKDHQRVTHIIINRDLFQLMVVCYHFTQEREQLLKRGQWKMSCFIRQADSSLANFSSLFLFLFLRGDWGGRKKKKSLTGLVILNLYSHGDRTNNNHCKEWWLPA